MQKVLWDKKRLLIFSYTKDIAKKSPDTISIIIINIHFYKEKFISSLSTFASFIGHLWPSVKGT